MVLCLRKRFNKLPIITVGSIIGSTLELGKGEPKIPIKEGKIEYVNRLVKNI